MAAGSWFGLPEMGWSEAFGGNKASTGGQGYGASPLGPLGSAGIALANLGSSSSQQPEVLSGFTQSNGTPYAPPPSNLTNNTPTTTSGGGGGNNTSSSDQKQIDNISGAWDGFIGSLKDQIGGLGKQAEALGSTIGSQFNSLAGDLGLQLGQGQTALAGNEADANQNQVTNLRDISSSIKNGFMAGNNYLGSIGAGDSSAANQYSFALNKIGTRQRSDVMQGTAKILADINNRKVDLKNTYDNEMNKLSNWKNEQINGVTQWFSEAQQQIQDQIGQGKISKAKDIASMSQSILDKAQSATNSINSQAQQWNQTVAKYVLENASTIEEGLANLQKYVPESGYNMPSAGNPDLSINPQTGAPNPAPFFSSNVGNTNEKDLANNGLFGN